MKIFAPWLGLFAIALASGCSASAIRSPARTTVAPDAGGLLDAWAAAAGGRERLARVGAVHVAGRIELGGLSGTLSIWHTARGARREEQQLGGVDDAVTIFDGAKGWRVDRNRKVRDLDGPELEEQTALAYLDAHAALLPDRHPGRVVRDGAGVRIEPAGGRPLTVRFDPTTHLPATFSRPDAETTHVTTFSDWRDVRGLQFPFTIREEDGDPRNTRTFHVDTVEVDAAAPAPAFSRPADAPPDYRFATGGQTSVPIELVAMLVFVRVGVNGSEPLDFILDTGAEVTVINQSRIARLGLHAIGKVGESAGGGNVEMSFVKDVTFALPGVTLAGQTVTAIPLDALEAPLGHAIDGVLGYDFLSRFVVEIDYARSRLTLRDPAIFRAPPKGTALAITLEGSVPYVRAGIEMTGRAPLAASFVVDTGCTCEVDFNSPFTRTNRLIEALPRTLTPPRGASRGAGGETDSVHGRIAALTLGGMRVPGPIASFARDTTGGMADPDSAGLIGGQIWRRFVVTFDYGRKAMWLEKNGEPDTPTSAAGSGIQWGPALGGIIVKALIDGAPGAEAGLAVGDRLVAVDGEAVGILEIAKLSALFKQVGRPHEVVVDRDGRKIKVTVTARELL